MWNLNHRNIIILSDIMRSELLTSRTLWPSCICSEATASLHKAMCCWYRRHRFSSPLGSRRSKTSGSRTAGRFRVPRIIGRNIGTLYTAITNLNVTCAKMLQTHYLISMIYSFYQLKRLCSMKWDEDDKKQWTCRLSIVVSTKCFFR